MFKNSILVLTFLAGTIFTMGCHNSDGPTKAELATYFAINMEKINTINPNQFFIAKLDTERGGNWVVFHTRYVGSGQNSFFAANLDLIDMTMTPQELEHAIFLGGSNAVDGVRTTGVRSYVSISGSGYVYETTEGSFKDLEKAAAVEESLRYNDLAQNLVSNYGLSEERGLEIAKLTLQWNKLKKSRALTDADADSFSKKLIGMNISEAQIAFAKAQTGDAASFEEVIEKAADFNGVSPEQMNEIISQLISQ